MLISPPFLPAPTAGETDEAYLNRAMLCGEPGDGFFPISFDLNWHGGTHLKAPKESGRALPVRAIADGTLAYFREPSPLDTSEDAPLNYSGWTDNGCIVLRHETEIGEGVNSKVVFFSIYMHLSKITMKEPKKGMHIYRKDVLGDAGNIYGTQDKIHFEIIAEDSQVKNLIGRTERELSYKTRSGRTESCWGDMYFYLPSEVIGYAARPSLWAETNNLSNCVRLPAEDLFVRMSYSRGQCLLSTFTLDGECVGEQKEEKNFEYDLYETALDRFPGCPSAGYELLRFGRVIGSDALVPTNAAHWRKIAFPEGDAWVNLNGSTITCFSDADFPQWLGWRLIDDDADEDSHCQSPYLRALLKLDEDPLYPPSRSIVEISKAPDFKHTPVKPEEENIYSKSYRIKKHNQQIIEKESSKKELKRCIFKFPSEWGANDFDTRYGWLKEESELGPAMPKGDYDKLKSHQQAMAFWEDAGLAGIGPKHWHFPPKEFVGIFRKCGWLSEKELTQLLPSNILRKDKSGWLFEAVTIGTVAKAKISAVKDDLNKALRKFLIGNSPFRMAAFFGNSTQETQWFGKLYENDSSARYHPWDGRGFFQLTWPDNYVKYWRFQGRKISESTAKSFSVAAKSADQTRSNSHLSDAALTPKGLTSEMIRWRHDVGDKSHDAAMSAGAYWVWTGAAQFADKSPILVRDTEQVGTKNYVYYRCESFGQVASTVNYGRPMPDPSKIKNVYGIVTRYQAYTNALTVLTEMMSYPDAAGKLNEKPEDFKSRRE
jgi:hydroxyethylthiazole kinase